MERFRFVTVVALATLGIGVVAPRPAAATNFTGANGQTGCALGSPVNMADTWEHNFYYDALISTTATAQTLTRTSDYDPTDLQTSLIGSPTPLTDVIVMDGNYTTYCGYAWDGATSGLYGLTTCVSLNVAFECEQHQIRYDNSDLDPASAANREAMTCHETGHTVGLTHRQVDASCIWQPFSGTRVLSAHDIAHINANYLPN